MRLENLKALEVLDSNGNYTIKVTAYAKGMKACATVPAGSSTGKHEARTINPLEAIELMPKILRRLRNEQLGNIDNLISTIPGNLATGISIATKKLEAKLKHKEPYELWGGNILPVPFMNIINGGMHAGNKLSFQEFLIAPLGRTFKESLRMAVETYKELRHDLKTRYGMQAINVGMEGGFAPPMNNVEEALKAIQNTLIRLGYIEEVRIGIDSAASTNYNGKTYNINGTQKTTNELIKYYEKLAKDYNLVSIEDPFHEEDFESFNELRTRLKNKCQIVSDDLTTTNPIRVSRAVNNKSANCLLVKINQIGTINQSLDAVRIARHDGWNIMVSHRSGDSCDPFIADYAVGINAGQIKTGAPARGERVAKYNRLLEIEEQLGNKARYDTKIIL